MEILFLVMLIVPKEDVSVSCVAEYASEPSVGTVAEVVLMPALLCVTVALP